jgi:heme/copper-type cytochrome/quinol oxidase subunit 1
VAHFHYVLSRGAVFGIFIGFYFWFEKRTGVHIPKIVGQIHFYTRFTGVNLTFFPRHFLGLAGRPRRIPDYPDAYLGWNQVASVGSYISLFATIFFFVGVWLSTFGGLSKTANAATHHLGRIGVKLLVSLARPELYSGVYAFISQIPYQHIKPEILRSRVYAV